MRLNPQQVKRVDLLPYWESGQIFEQTSWGSLEINYTGRPEALIASVTSVDQTGTYVFDARIDNRLAAGFHGEYWSVEGDNDTAVTVKNITDKDATCQLSLQYDRGRRNFIMQPMTLRPGEARMIMLREVQHSRVTGTDGKSLPVEATFGGMKLTEGPGGRHFLIDAVVYNAKTATCGVCGYGCLYPASINIPGGAYIIAQADSGELIAVNAHMCDGTNQTGWASVSTFAMDNTGVATVNSNDPAHGWGVNQGDTMLRATAADVPGPQCGDQTLHAANTASVLTPDHVKVILDQSGYLASCPNTGLYLRQIKVQVVSSSSTGNKSITSPMSVAESYSNLSTNTCDPSKTPTASACAPADAGGQFLDSMAVSDNLCNSGINRDSGCGFTLTSTWSICSGTAHNSIWTSTRETRSNSVKVNGQTANYAAGTYLNP